MRFEAGPAICEGFTVGRWSSAEESSLKELVSELGEKSWATVAERMGTGRSKAGVEQHWQIMTGKRAQGPPSKAVGRAL